MGIKNKIKKKRNITLQLDSTTVAMTYNADTLILGTFRLRSNLQNVGSFSTGAHIEVGPRLMFLKFLKPSGPHRPLTWNLRGIPEKWSVTGSPANNRHCFQSSTRASLSVLIG